MPAQPPPLKNKKQGHLGVQWISKDDSADATAELRAKDRGRFEREEEMRAATVLPEQKGARRHLEANHNPLTGANVGHQSAPSLTGLQWKKSEGVLGKAKPKSNQFSVKYGGTSQQRAEAHPEAADSLEQFMGAKPKGVGNAYADKDLFGAKAAIKKVAQSPDLPVSLRAFCY